MEGHGAAVQQVLAPVSLSQYARSLPKLQRTLPRAHRSGANADQHEGAVGGLDGWDISLLDNRANALDGDLQFIRRELRGAELVSQSQEHHESRGDAHRVGLRLLHRDRLDRLLPASCDARDGEHLGP